jgi:hypothetical protein
VREALEKYVEYRLAVTAGDKYVVSYRRLQKGTLEYLLKKFAPKKPVSKGARPAPGQMALFKERKRVRIEAKAADVSTTKPAEEPGRATPTVPIAVAAAPDEEE